EVGVQLVKVLVRSGLRRSVGAFSGLVLFVHVRTLQSAISPVGNFPTDIYKINPAGLGYAAWACATSPAYVQDLELITTAGCLLSGSERELPRLESRGNSRRHLQHFVSGSCGFPLFTLTGRGVGFRLLHHRHKPDTLDCFLLDA